MKCNTVCIIILIEGTLEVELPTIWTDEKQRWEESEKRRGENKYQKKESLRRKKIQVREKVGCRETLCFCNDLISIIAIFNPRS